MSENKKPRICEVLGVEIGEEWKYPVGYQTVRFRLTAAPGNIIILETINDDDINGRWDDASGTFTSLVFIEIFTHPEKIIHEKKSRWTAEDIADAKAVRRLCPWAEKVERSERNAVVFIIQSDRIKGAIGGILPSLKPGETVTLDEILEAENG